MSGVPFEELLLRNLEALPASDRAVSRLIQRLRETSKLPPELAAPAARFPLRFVGALSAEIAARPSTARKVCGLMQLTDEDVRQALYAVGEWYGEADAFTVRRLMMAVESGIAPRIARQVLSISEEEMVFLSDLLDLDARWRAQVSKRIRSVEEDETRGRLRKWLAIAGVLGTLRPKKVRQWRRTAKELAS